jgi:predicted metal-dependent enzyme (double-stranded beta helix superfamily)
MTHHDDTFERIPTHLALDPRAGDGKPVEEVRLLVRGQGTVGLVLATVQPFTVTIGSPDEAAFRWSVDETGATLSECGGGEWKEVAVALTPPAALDPEPNCVYWFSFDAHNRALIYGKGEMRLRTQLASHDNPRPVTDAPDPYAWFAQAASVQVAPGLERPADVWRDPVTVEPALKVLPVDAITMEQMAKGTHTVAANLTPICQQLYSNVVGRRFTLETEDFPQFGDAIEESIADPDGWCRKTLDAKASEFGTPDPDKTYLRITMGTNQGESPGIPFVVEVWPPGHYSPIHNHGGADAVIRVLRGQIHVSLFAMLSIHHQEPFGDAFFDEGDVTWISPRLNQTHRLKNDGDITCVTIQCYMYAESDTTHWPYFDYIEKAGIGHFDPNSDMDFLDFKAKMKEEWRARHPESPGA